MCSRQHYDFFFELITQSLCRHGYKCQSSVCVALSFHFSVILAGYLLLNQILSASLDKFYSWLCGQSWGQCSSVDCSWALNSHLSPHCKGLCHHANSTLGWSRDCSAGSSHRESLAQECLGWLWWSWSHLGAQRKPYSLVAHRLASISICTAASFHLTATVVPVISQLQCLRLRCALGRIDCSDQRQRDFV